MVATTSHPSFIQVDIIVAGYGSINLENIQRLASRDSLGFSFPDARSIVNYLERNELKPNVLIKDITLLNTNQEVSNLQDIDKITIKLTVVNLMVKDDIPAFTTIWFRSSAEVVFSTQLVIEEPIKPQRQRTFQHDLPMAKFTSILQMPCSVSFELDTSQATQQIDLYAQYSAFEISTSTLLSLPLLSPLSSLLSPLSSLLSL